MGGGGESITSAAAALGSSVEAALGGEPPASGRGGDGGLVFTWEEATPEGTGSPFKISGVFDRGGGVDFPLSSVGSEERVVTPQSPDRTLDPDPQPANIRL